MMTSDRQLFVIADEIEAILAREVDPETGEITDATVERLEALELAKDRKALEVAAYLKGERAEAQKIREVAEGLVTRAMAHEARADRLERFVASCLEPGQDLADPRVEVRWSKSQAVVIEDAELVPDEYWIQPPAPPKRIEKKLVRDAIKLGVLVPGASLIRTHTMRVK